MNDDEIRRLTATVASEAAARATDIAAKIAAEVTARDTMKLVVKETVDETLRGLGFDVDNPMSIQQNNAFITSLRASSGALGRQALFVVLGAVLLGVLTLIWSNIKGP